MNGDKTMHGIVELWKRAEKGHSVTVKSQQDTRNHLHQTDDMKVGWGGVMPMLFKNRHLEELRLEGLHFFNPKHFVLA